MTDRATAGTGATGTTDATGPDASAAGGGAAPAPRDWRARLRGSRFGTLGVLVVTTLLVLVGAWFVQDATGGSDVSDVATTAEATGPAPEIGAPAQDFTARTIDGRTVRLSDYRGRPVWLLFGASWCASCRAEAPDVQAVHEKARAAGVEVLAVYLGEDAMTVRDYVSDTGLTYTHVPDPETSLSSRYRVMGIPAHYFVAPDGTIDSIQVGALDAERMTESLAALRR